MVSEAWKIDGALLRVACPHNPVEFTERARIEDRILGLLFGRGDALAKLMVRLGLRRLYEGICLEVQHVPLLSDILDNPILKDWFE